MLFHPGNLPNQWISATIEEICLFNPKHGKELNDDLEITFVPMAAVDATSGTIVEMETRLLGKVRKGYTHFSEGDVIFAKITPCMENGKSAIALTLTNGIGCGSTEFHVLRPTAGLVPEYLHYYLRQESYRNLAAQNMTGVVGQRRVPKQFILETSLPLPPLNEQRRIVAKIDQLTTHSRRARQALDDLPTLIDQFRQSVLAAAFRGDLTADWRKQNPDVEPAEQLLERIRADRRQRWEDAELEKMRAKGKEPKDDKWKEKYQDSRVVTDCTLEFIPETWTLVTLDELSQDTKNSFTIGPFGSNLKVSDYCESGVPLIFVREIRSENFGNIQTKFISKEKAKELASHVIVSGDLLITKMGDPPGDTAVYPINQPDGIITADCIKLSPDTNLTSSEFLKYWLRAKPIKSRVLEETKGVAQQKLSLKRFRSIIIPLPPLEEQERILDSLKENSDMISDILALVAQSNKDIDLLDQSILAKAFRGELVPQDPTDEPASVLLERIRSQRENPPKPTKKSRKTQKS